MEGGDHVNPTRGRGRGRGRGRNPARGESHSRSVNFSDKETEDLLSAAQEVQTKSRRNDVKFTPSEWNAVFEAYHRLAPGSQRGVDMLRNRFKTLRTEYNNLKCLVGRSGWSWNWTTHQVMAPPGGWNALLAQNYNKWRYYPTKKFPFFREFEKLVGTSAIVGDFATPSESGQNSGTGSSGNPVAEEDEPVIDSEERARFDAQESRYEPDNQTVEGNRLDEPTDGQQASQETGRTGNRSASSNKRKSTDEAEGSRSRRAKKAIADGQARDAITTDALGSIARSSDRLVQQNDEFLAIAQKRLQLHEAEFSKNTIGQRVEQVLISLHLNVLQRFKVMDALNPQRQSSFLNATSEEQRLVIGELIPGFFQPYNGGVHGNDGANGNPYSYYGGYNGGQAPN